MAIGFDSLWVADCDSRSVYRINLQSHKVTAVIATGLADPEGELSLAVGAGSVWVMADSKGTLARIDPHSNKVIARIQVAEFLKIESVFADQRADPFKRANVDAGRPGLVGSRRCRRAGAV